MKTDAPDSSAARKAWLSALAKAPADRLCALFAAAHDTQAFEWLRKPEVGGVMVRGRMAGTGGAFNLGEMTVTRASLRLGCGTVGHGYVQGRSKAAAEVAALMDALMQTDAAGTLQAKVLDVLAAEAAAHKELRAQKAAATKVDFFTMVRGHD